MPQYGAWLHFKKDGNTNSADRRDWDIQMQVRVEEFTSENDAKAKIEAERRLYSQSISHWQAKKVIKVWVVERYVE